MSEMSVVAIAESLDRMGLDIAEAVIERARAELVKPPSIAQLYEVAHDIHVETAERDRPALPSAEEFVSAMPDDIRAKVRAMVDPDRKRREREAEIADQDADWQRVKTATLARLRMHGTCLGTDKPPVQVDGMLVCPVCRVEVVRA